jgi:HSP20 family protein
MSNTLVNRERNGGASLLGRPFGELWGLDPFRFSGIEVARTDTGYTIEMPVAGFKAEHIDVTLEDGILTVSGKNEKRSFTRAISVPEDVDEERIEARVEDGMLTLTLTLLPKAQPKKIAVKTQ